MSEIQLRELHSEINKVSEGNPELREKLMEPFRKIVGIHIRKNALGQKTAEEIVGGSVAVEPLFPQLSDWGDDKEVMRNPAKQITYLAYTAMTKSLNPYMSTRQVRSAQKEHYKEFKKILKNSPIYLDRAPMDQTSRGGSEDLIANTAESLASDTNQFVANVSGAGSGRVPQQNLADFEKNF